MFPAWKRRAESCCLCGAKTILISPYLSADGVYPVGANLLPQSSSSFVLGRFPVLRRNSPIRSRPRGPRRRGGLGQQVSAYGAKRISAKIIVRRFDGRMAFVPEGPAVWTFSCAYSKRPKDERKTAQGFSPGKVKSRLTQAGSNHAACEVWTFWVARRAKTE